MSVNNGRNNTFEKQHIQNIYYGTLSEMFMLLNLSITGDFIIKKGREVYVTIKSSTV